jgi:two-component system LytT family response regulator
MMRAFVIDDEPLARSGVLARLAGHKDVQVAGEYGDGAQALAAVVAERPDLIFLDVEMPGCSGMELLSALEPAQRPLVILLTAYDSFAVQAFAFNVVDYLLKPVEDERFAEAVERARVQMAVRAASKPAPSGPARYASTFTVRSGARALFVDADDLVRIESAGDYATLHAGGREHLVRESLQRLMQRLDPARFVRVHRTAIVRIDQIEEMRTLANRDALLRLRDGTPVRVSRTYIDNLTRALGQARG